ncbi:hypothetical protein BUALT_Bualt09G0119500 [Buddleja alternifolia]|uniref:Uncharacterized protein n=1 Tax=Buddleja alternifolia TaxID=168488 RepID=A0AAV6X3A9_9LAMI|nr:hypothetical protein BUALT_Bualt09G0119500 [Buddleja alternifolia]
MHIIALVAVFLLAVGAKILSVAPTVKSRGLTRAAIFVVAVSGHAVGYFIVKYRALTAVPVAPSADPTP